MRVTAELTRQLAMFEAAADKAQANPDDADNHEEMMERAFETAAELLNEVREQSNKRPQIDHE